MFSKFKDLLGNYFYNRNDINVISNSKPDCSKKQIELYYYSKKYEIHDSIYNNTRSGIEHLNNNYSNGIITDVSTVVNMKKTISTYCDHKILELKLGNSECNILMPFTSKKLTNLWYGL